MQKALTALNSLPQGNKLEDYTDVETDDALNRAKEQAYALFVKASDLREVRFTSNLANQ